MFNFGAFIVLNGIDEFSSFHEDSGTSLSSTYSPTYSRTYTHYVLCDYHEAFWTHLIESRSNHYLSVKVCLRAEDDPQGPQGPSSPRQDREGQPGAPLGPPGQVQSTRTRHSPPVSRPNSEYDHHLEVKNYIFSLLLLKK